MPGYANYQSIRGARSASECRVCGGAKIYQAPDTDIRCFCETHPTECDDRACPYCLGEIEFEEAEV